MTVAELYDKVQKLYSEHKDAILCDSMFEVDIDFEYAPYEDNELIQVNLDYTK